MHELSGSDFNRAFLDEQRIDLAEEVELLRTEETSGTHASLRAFAHKHLGELRKDVKKLADVAAHDHG